LPEGEKSVLTEKLAEIVSQMLLAELTLKVLTDLQAVVPNHSYSWNRRNSCRPYVFIQEKLNYDQLII
jgi:hypothetical protein